MKKKIVTLLTALALMTSLCACQSKETKTASSEESVEVTTETETEAEEVEETEAKDSEAVTYRVGICNYVDDASLNQIVDNIKTGLDAIGEEKNVKFVIEYDNCNADSNVLSQIIANFIADDVDLMVGVATPVAMSMQAQTEDNQIPVVFAAVSDPVAAGVVDSMEAPGANITGTSDYLDTNAIMNLILAQNPDIAKVGLLYDVGQDASTTAIAQAKEFLESKNIEYVEHTGTNVDEVSLAVDAFISDKAEAIFTPSDNTIMTAELSIYEKMADAGIPHYAGADSFALNGAFLGYGVDYANLGLETADMIAGILIDGNDPATTPVRTFDNRTATVNTDICDALGIDFEEVKEKFAPYCTKVESITTAESFED
ncbi:MAG: ABC transporter substrate-binding protein [Lachnospiraceae bacterium]|nr:ABC transporter substrate-binding protein [Lachnospiraceae bacterium]